MKIPKAKLPAEGLRIAAGELRQMKAVFIAGNLLLLAAAAALSAEGGIDFRYFTGIAAGNIMASGYFLTLGWTAGMTLGRKHKNEIKARNFANMLYGIRYAGMFGVCCLLMALNAVNFVFTVVPLFFVTAHYRLKLFGKNSSRQDYEKEYTEFSGGEW